MDSGQIRAKFRVPVETVEVVPRLWSESEVLRAMSPRVGEVPRCLADFGAWSLQAYLAGQALADETPKGPVGVGRLSALAEFFARLVGVPHDALPHPPSDWPGSGDSIGFLHRLARFTEHQVHLANRPRFGRLFDAVGVPRDMVSQFLRSVPELTPRPFAFLHTDVHRANVVVTPTDEGEQLSVIDWELTLYGDPLHDLATHLVRMDYDRSEHELMVGLWTDAMREAGHGDKTAGIDQDLDHYLGFEYVQSVFPDVMRAALALPDDPAAEDFAQAAERVCGALGRAWAPLGLKGEPVDESTAAEAVREWHEKDRADATDRGFFGRADRARPARAVGRRCPDADHPRGTARRLRRPQVQESAVDVGELLVEGLERHGC
ncbi:phosphotransferase family protein [Streptomyces sp. NPDC058676]